MRKKLNTLNTIVSILCAISVLAFFSISQSFVYASDAPIVAETSSSDFDGETVLSSYIEDGELYVVTMSSSEIPPGGGKCPSRTKDVTSTVSRDTLKKWRDSSNLENRVKGLITDAIAGAFSMQAAVVVGIVNPFIPTVASDCNKILDNSTKKSIKIVATFSCSQKVQAGNWFHVWKLSSVRAY